MIASVANSVWFAACVPEYFRFRRALRHVREEQADVLAKLLRRNQSSEFGRRHGFHTIRNARQYQRRVPLRDYEGYRGVIDRLAEGAAGLLTKEQVQLFQPTSGSAGAKKWIPYTHTLRHEFQLGIRAWVADMFSRTPDLMRGPAYWSVSPVESNQQMTPSGIRVGFAEDSEYVGGLQQKLVLSLMAVPSQIRRLRNPDEFWYTTLLHLIQRRDLRFISVWNPSFLTLLMNRLPEFTDRLSRDVPQTRQALNAAAPAERHTLLWPRLHTISCWSDGNSGGAAARLSRLFPQARIEGKGVIATEGIVSFPFGARAAAEGHTVLAVRSHFMEFLPVSSNDEPDFERPLLAHELDRGARYSVVLSTGGGLYRYHLADQIEVTGYEHQCPAIKFIGRSQVSDWCGEKLHEAHVARILSATFRDFHVAPTFAMLACDANGPIPHYVLYVESDLSEATLRTATARLDEALQENFHYRYARRLGQLGPVRAFAARNAEASYVAACVALGQLRGNIKSVLLDRRGDWTSKFQGRFVAGEFPAEIKG